jgi:hypothetical protein
MRVFFAKKPAKICKFAGKGANIHHEPHTESIKPFIKLSGFHGIRAAFFLFRKMGS